MKISRNKRQYPIKDITHDQGRDYRPSGTLRESDGA
jgi:hypothetical protein